MGMKKDNGYNFIRPFLLIAALAMFLSFCVDMTGETLRRPAYFFVIISVVLVCVAFKQFLTKDVCIWTMIAGAMVKVGYIIYTAVWTRQHDVISFGAGEGHAAYIEYILTTHSLPNFDPRLVWGFFQPPLHHIISAAWMWLNIRLGMAERQLQENVQVLTLCYMLALMVFVYFICREIGMKKRGTLLTMIIVSFHPVYILLSGSINNDALSLVLSVIALYLAILWYKNPRFITIIGLALAIGLSMMAKLTAALTAPGIAAIMLYKFIKDKNLRGKYILQYIAFAVTVFPIGLWWTVRNMVLWGMPVNYIPEVGEQLTSSGLVSRIFDLRMNSVYPAMINNGAAYDEYNVILAMIKTSLFGESDFGQISSFITVFATGLFVTSAILIVIQIIAMERVLFAKENGIDIGFRILFGVTAVTYMAGYMSFALSYNNFSAQDFRYAAILVSIMSLFMGLWDDRISDADSNKKGVLILRKALLIISVIFAVCSAEVYILVGLL